MLTEPEIFSYSVVCHKCGAKHQPKQITIPAGQETATIKALCAKCWTPIELVIHRARRIGA